MRVHSLHIRVNTHVNLGLGCCEIIALEKLICAQVDLLIIIIVIQHFYQRCIIFIEFL